MNTCQNCGAALAMPRKLKTFCSYSCRGQSAVAALDGPRYRTGLIGSKNLKRVRALRNLKRQGIGATTCERINSVTWRLDARQKNGVGWVIDVGPNRARWIVRVGNDVSNPDSLEAAKAAGIAMARGAYGDYSVTRPIAHLNGLSARLVDRDS